MKALTLTRDFIIDYMGRHKHPVNAVLHILGVPMVFYSIPKFFSGEIALASGLFVLGYFLQYLGHKAQGNEVGEVILIKKICSKFCKCSSRTEQNAE